MKKLLYLLAMVAIMVLPACEGPEGPQGPPGVDGIDGQDGEDGENGISLLNLVAEAQVDFTAENNYSAGFQFEIGPSDNFLVFMLWNVIEDQPLWRPLPQTVFLDEGVIINYNYQYTANVISVFMTGNTDISNVSEDWALNHVFRIVYLPGEFIQSNAKVDLNDYDAVTNALGVRENEVIKLD